MCIHVSSNWKVGLSFRALPLGSENPIISYFFLKQNDLWKSTESILSHIIDKVGYIIWQHGLKYSLSGWATQNYKRIQAGNWYSGIESKNSCSFWCSNLLFSDPLLFLFLTTYQITEAFIFNKKRRKYTKSRNKVPNGYLIVRVWVFD